MMTNNDFTEDKDQLELLAVGGMTNLIENMLTVNNNKMLSIRI